MFASVAGMRELVVVMGPSKTDVTFRRSRLSV
ncbi:hypothetical protein F558DRAFT_05859 [Streptomyces sp. AmelKG-A3]|nr:hypothetical protein GA0115247_10587 [Streptomyces sp. PalvLS-984]SDE24989.1 hypothetical protein F558DRAFT_05859 [Streptomyces sp. AmelKG-A3]